MKYLLNQCKTCKILGSFLCNVLTVNNLRMLYNPMSSVPNDETLRRMIEHLSHPHKTKNNVNHCIPESEKTVHFHNIKHVVKVLNRRKVCGKVDWSGVYRQASVADSSIRLIGKVDSECIS